MKKLISKEAISFYLMFISLFIVGLESNIYLSNLIELSNYNLDSIRYNLVYLSFNMSWIILFLTIAYVIKKNKTRIIYFTLLNIFFIVLLCAHIIYCQQMGKFMIFSDLFLAGEGLQYLEVIFVNLNFGLVLAVLISVVSNIILIIYNKEDYQQIYQPKKIVIGSLIALIFVLRIISIICLGNEINDTSWKAKYNPRNIYKDYNNPNTSAYLSGFYEYNYRCIYKYFYNIVTLDKTSLKTGIDNYNNIYGITRLDNDYTGLFKDKNVIFIMMESIDSWIIDEETMPTLTTLKKEGLDFTNRYSPFFNGGQTLNSEFALNSGLYAITNRKAVYDIDMPYNYSLANMLKKEGYKVNSFHGNTGKFYNRSELHNRFGYEHHYSFKDMQDANILDKDTNYLSDSKAISDDKVFDLMTDGDKFLSFYTTYSAHLEYNKGNKVYKSINHTLKTKEEYTEEELIYRTLCNDTDNFLKILIQKLEKKGILDDTILVLVTDHYVYGYSDTDYVAIKKGTINDRKYLQNTPFIIWGKNIKSEKIDTILDTADILPTLLNLLDIDYNPNNYLGIDVFSNYHDDFIWFSDGDYIKSPKCNLTEEAIHTKIDYNIMKNYNILVTNYYGKK